MATLLGQFAAFDHLTPEQYRDLIEGWKHRADVHTLAREQNLPVELVEAFFGILSLIAYEKRVGL